MPVLALISLRLSPRPRSSRAYSILSAGWAMGRPTWRPCGFGDGAGMGGAFGGEGAFHLGEQRQQQEGDAAHALVGSVDRQRVGQGPDTDAAPGKVVDEVEDFAQVAADPVQGVHHDRVAGPGVGQQLVQAVALDGGRRSSCRRRSARPGCPRR